MNAHPYKVGDVVRLVKDEPVPVRVTIRECRNGGFVVDDGDPANDDARTNGWRMMAFALPADVEPV